MTIQKLINDVRSARAEIVEASELSDAIERSDDLVSDLIALAEEVLDLEVLAEAVALRIGDLSKRKSRYEKTAETLRGIILQAMDINGIDSIPSDVCTLVKSRKRDGVVVTDEALIPSRFFVQQKPKLDKKALNDAVLKDGEVIDGAEMTNGGIQLTIKKL